MLNHPHPLHVVDRGRGDRALVFLHYFAGSSRAWAPVMDRLADYRCIALDLRGFGNSDGPATGYAVDIHGRCRGADRFARPCPLRSHRPLDGRQDRASARGPAAARPGGPAPDRPLAADPGADLDDVRRILASRGDRASAEDTARAIMMAGRGRRRLRR